MLPGAYIMALRGVAVALVLLAGLILTGCSATAVVNEHDAPAKSTAKATGQGQVVTLGNGAGADEAPAEVEQTYLGENGGPLNEAPEEGADEALGPNSFADDEYADGSFDDDPFADDPFADDPFADDPFSGEEEAEVYDPIEPLNRATFWFNDKLYFYALKPVARGYRFLVPQNARTGVANFFSNLTTPVRLVNSLFQLKGEDATRELFRFIINSTVGVFGLMDVARDYGGLYKKEEDLGQTLGHWGVGHGLYLVLPVLGPSSVRDGVGTVGDFFLDPITYADYTFLERAGIWTGRAVNKLSLDKDTYEAIVEQSLDPYLDVRNGYMQMRASQVDK